MSTWQKRLKHMDTLEKGWLWGEGEPITPFAKKRAEEVLAVFDKGELAKGARIFPRLNGGIQFEWNTMWGGIEFVIPTQEDESFEFIGYTERVGSISKLLPSSTNPVSLVQMFLIEIYRQGLKETTSKETET